MQNVARAHDPEISIVAPCYNEVAVVGEFHRRCKETLKTLRRSYEIVLVDDGSTDGTWEKIGELADQDPHVVGVRLMRNHGHQGAATAGLAICRGEAVLLIDADLQDPPELLGPMLEVMEGGADVVYGQRVSREAETWFKKASASAFYRLLSHLSSIPIPRDTGDFRLMSRRVVDVLANMPEHQRFIRGMISWIGGNQVAFPYHRQARYAGESKYPLTKMVRFAVDAITSFSATPLRLATYLGFLTALFALMLLSYTVWQWANGATVVGWASVMTVIVFFSAVQLIVLGITGEYIGRVFQEVKDRPNFVIDSIKSGQQSRSIPVDFCKLPPEARSAFWRTPAEASSQASGNGLGR